VSDWSRSRKSVAVFGAIAVAVAVADAVPGALEASATTVALIAAAALLIAGASSPETLREIGQRVSNVKVGGFELGLVERERALVVSRHATAEDDGVAVDDRPVSADPVADLEKVRELLRNNLQWIATSLPPTEPSEPNDWLSRFYSRLLRQPLADVEGLVAFLRTERLIGAETAILVNDLLSLPPSAFVAWPSAAREDVLDQAWRVAFRLKSDAFDRLVRRMLIEEGYPSVDFPQRRGHRADFLVWCDERWLRVTCRRVLTLDSDLLAKTKRRLVRTKSRPTLGEPRFAFDIVGRIVVVPDRAPSGVQEAGDPAVIKVCDLIARLRAHGTQ
jgi:hypothetical protein